MMGVIKGMFDDMEYWSVTVHFSREANITVILLYVPNVHHTLSQAALHALSFNPYRNL